MKMFGTFFAPPGIITPLNFLTLSLFFTR